MAGVHLRDSGLGNRNVLARHRRRNSKIRRRQKIAADCPRKGGAKTLTRHSCNRCVPSNSDRLGARCNAPKYGPFSGEISHLLGKEAVEEPAGNAMGLDEGETHCCQTNAALRLEIGRYSGDSVAGPVAMPFSGPVDSKEVLAASASDIRSSSASGAVVATASDSGAAHVTALR